MSSVTLARPATVAAPRAAAWAADLWFAVGQAFRRSAEVRTSQLAADTVRREATEVRELAWHMLSQDPRMAADLLAAADRHERDRTHQG